ncbi:MULTISPECIES: hypothetical protein [unclassified Pedobacter]|uniref:hypothetical protein n=1 Tax=unclassified Pedobacter TaxID=2628915 RepID=UPI0014214A36|nr:MULTISPECIES: hypothetical protein [unclassified Pedobacter]NII84582.1 hypothetical protein [Pedobacter sp. SG908]NMN38504.1 hypothetical protein [Pedobacter sp. SG918]
MSKPYYLLEFSVSACRFIVEINDLEVLNLSVEDGMSSMLPLNHGIFKSGNQKVKITLESLEEGVFNLEPSTSFKIIEYSAGHTLEFKNDIKAFTPDFKENGKKHSYEAQTSFNSVMPYQIESWTEGVNLTDINKLEERLDNFYATVKSIFKRKEYVKIREIFSKKENNIASMMYLNQEQSEARLNSIFQDMENGFEFDDSIVAIPYFLKNGKVVSFRNPLGSPAIKLVNPELGEEIYVELNVMMDKSKMAFEVI